MVFIGEECSKRRVNAYIPKYISMAYYIMYLWIPGRDATRSKVTGNFLVNALHAFHRFNGRYQSKNPRNFMAFKCFVVRDIAAIGNTFLRPFSKVKSIFT